MRTVEVLIIGGGAAGTTAAETYRAGGGAGEVVIVSDEPHRLYSRVLLPHAVKGKIGEERVFLKTEDFYEEKGVELLTSRSVLYVDPRHRVVKLDDGTEIGFKKLVIAAGAKPRRLGVRGEDLPGVLHLQTFEDVARIREAAAPGKRVVIVGSGFIALEFAAIAVETGMQVTILNRGPHFWTSALGPATGAAVEATLRAKGVDVRHGVKVSGFDGDGRVTSVSTASGDGFPCDMVGVGVGVAVPTEPFGDMAGDRGILADAFLAARHEGVWAAGDCAEFEDESIGGLRHVAGNWTNAIAQGRHVGQALLGRREKFSTLTAYSSNVFPGANLIFVGEAKALPGATRVERVIEDDRKIVQFQLFEGRVIGASLLNAPDQRAAVAALIMEGKPQAGEEGRLADPTVPLDSFR